MYIYIYLNKCAWYDLARFITAHLQNIFKIFYKYFWVKKLCNKKTFKTQQGFFIYLCQLSSFLAAVNHD